MWWVLCFCVFSSVCPEEFGSFEAGNIHIRLVDGGVDVGRVVGSKDGG